MKLSYPVCCPDAKERVMAWCGRFDEAFYFLKNAGYEGIELLVRNPDTIDAGHVKELLKENALSVSAIGTTPMQKEDHLFLMSEDGAVRKEAVRRLYGLIELGAAFDAPVLVGKYRGMVKDAPGCRLQDFGMIMKEADAFSAEKNVPLFLEPQSESNINNLNSIGEAVSWIRENELGNVKLLMDIFHMNLTEASIADSIREYAAYAGMIHMTDSERLVPCFGAIDMREVLGALKETGFDGYLSMEIKQAPDTETVARLSAMALTYVMER